MIRIETAGQVKLRYREVTEEIVTWLKETQKLPKKLKIWLTTDKVFQKLKKPKTWYAFCGVGDQITIVIKQTIDYFNFIIILMHEFCHYEQFCKLGTANHRGVFSRSLSLAEKFMEWKCNLTGS